MSTSKPLVLIIDLDGTIIGDISPQIARYEIHALFHKKPSCQIPLLFGEFEKGLLRENFKSFLHELKKVYGKNLEIFIYTASEKKWGAFILRVIEKFIAHDFNRPFFTREHCIMKDTKWTKSISKILPTIFKKIKHKYPLLTLNELKEQTMFIDNNKTIKDDHEKQKLLKCPTYGYFQPCDALNGVTITEKTIANVSQVLMKYGFLARIHTSVNLFYSEYYANLSMLYKTCHIEREKRNDPFWKHLEEIFKMHHFKTLTSKNVEYIRHKMQQSKE